MSKYKEATDKTTGDYPVVISKMDPLIIRVSPLVLVVGTTSYSAKIKTAIKWKGFFIYSSGLGEPIYQQEFKNSDNLQNTNSENSPLYLAVKEEATKWIDSLEDSFATASEKNIVDMLREIKFQNHFDLTGHTANASDYPNLEMCTDTPTYIHKILEQLTELNVKLNNLNAIIFGGTLQKVTVDGTDIRVDSIGEITSDNDSTLKNKSIIAKMTSLSDKIENVQKSIGIADDKDETVQEHLKNLTNCIGKPRKEDDSSNDVITIQEHLNQLSEYINTIIKAIGYNSNKSGITLFTNLDNIKDSISGVSEKVNTLNATLGNVNSSIGDVNSSIGDVNSSIGDVNSSMTSIKSALNGEGNSIYNAITNGYSAVTSAIDAQTGKINEVKTTLETLNGNVESVSDNVKSVGNSIGTYTDYHKHSLWSALRTLFVDNEKLISHAVFGTDIGNVYSPHVTFSILNQSLELGTCRNEDATWGPAWGLGVVYSNTVHISGAAENEIWKVR